MKIKKMSLPEYFYTKRFTNGFERILCIVNLSFVSVIHHERRTVVHRNIGYIDGDDPTNILTP